MQALKSPKIQFFFLRRGPLAVALVEVVVRSRGHVLPGQPPRGLLEEDLGAEAGAFADQLGKMGALLQRGCAQMEAMQ